MLRGVLESQAPPRQYAGDTIDTFSSRLVNATLLEDKRQAILGLRSFAKEYPATVASGGLKPLIESLTQNIDDVDTGKIVLETLLALSNPNEDSPEADDDIALLVADQFTQRQDHVTALLDLLENPDYYSRLYSLRLLYSINSARPERTQDCIQNAPLGIPRLVAILDDSREAIRTAGLDLLNNITESSLELQKIVAFQDAFARVFALIEAEGSLTEGGVVVQDCLNLLANLLRLNTSNQTTFREEGFVPRLADLFRDEDGEDDFGGSFANKNKDKNIWGALAVLRMFLVRGSMGTQANQFAFHKHKLLQIILQLSFDASVGAPIRAEALRTCADMIRNNPQLQVSFGGMQVPFEQPSSPKANGLTFNGERHSNDRSHSPGPRSRSSAKSKKQQRKFEMVYVIEALLDLALSTYTVSLFDVRYAAVEVIEAYIENHSDIRHHFLDRAIGGHKSGADETGNIVTILLGGPDAYRSSDPYRLWFAAIIALRLIYDDTECKDKLRSVSEGNEEEGEELVICIQILTGHLISSFQDGLDERICLAYLMLLSGWLFEDPAAINDLLSEGSTFQSLVALTSRPAKDRIFTQGLGAALLGIIYEFSTKDSPIPRTKLQPLLTSGLGREQYIQKLARLREHPALRDFEVIPQNLSTALMPGTLPEVHFDDLFVAFLKDNFSRLNRALDKDPKKEVVLQAEAGVDRDVVDSLRSEINLLRTELGDLKTNHENEMLVQERKLNGAMSDLHRAQDEVQRVKNINEGLRRGHDEEMAGKEAEHRSVVERLRYEHSRSTQEAMTRATADYNALDRQRREVEQTHGKKTQELERQLQVFERTVKGHEDTMARLKSQLSELHTGKKESDEEVNKRGGRIMEIENEKAVLQESLDLANANVRKLEAQSQDNEKLLKEARNVTDEIRKELKDVQEDAMIANEQVKELQAKEKENEERVMTIEKEKTQHIKRLEKDINQKEDARKAVQTELDDLFVVLGDVEEKRTRDKRKLKELGVEVSDAEDDDDEEGAGEDDNEAEDENENEGASEEREESSDIEKENDDNDKEEEGSGEEEEDQDEGEVGADTASDSEKDSKKPSHERESSVD